MKPALIAAPFGVYLNTNWATSVRGTYTLSPRPGRYVQSLKTFRKIRGGWVNRMGFRNPGIETELLRIASVEYHPENDTIWSIGAVKCSSEWEQLFDIFPHKNVTVELNVGCPNVIGGQLHLDMIKAYVKSFKSVILKVPGNYNDALKWFQIGYDGGIRTFHFCNTIPTDKGGESSRRIQDISIPIITNLKSQCGSTINCIGGGGIYTPADVRRYKDAGADHISLATCFLTPWRIPAIRKEIYK